MSESVSESVSQQHGSMRLIHRMISLKTESIGPNEKNYSKFWICWKSGKYPASKNLNISEKFKNCNNSPKKCWIKLTLSIKSFFGWFLGGVNFMNFFYSTNFRGWKVFFFIWGFIHSPSPLYSGWGNFFVKIYFNL